MVAGPAFNGNDGVIAVVRHNQDGSLDSSFYGDGILLVDIDASKQSNDLSYGLMLDSLGRIVVAGSATADFAGTGQVSSSCIADESIPRVAVIRNDDGSDNWMWKAAMDGKLSILQALVDLGVDVNETRDHGDPANPFYQPEGAIFEASGKGYLELVRWLLEHGAKINFVVHGQRRCMPLVNAAIGGYSDVVKLLVEHGADIQVRTR